MLPRTVGRIYARPRLSGRGIATLTGYPHIYVYPDSQSLKQSHILTLLSTEPPTVELAIGSTTELPPTPQSLTENRKFLSILQDVLRLHAFQDPGVISQAQAMASSSGSTLGSGGIFFPQRGKSSRKGAHGPAGDGAGGASSQGGAGGGGMGGWIHVSDTRKPPDYGRIAEPEDIFGSLEVNGKGEFVGDAGSYQTSGTYRLVTRDGFFGLSPFLREKLVQRLREEERLLQ